MTIKHPQPQIDSIPLHNPRDEINQDYNRHRQKIAKQKVTNYIFKTNTN